MYSLEEFVENIAAINEYLYLQGSDEDFSGISTVFVNWKADDQESGIRSCEWAVGKGLSFYEQNITFRSTVL